MSLAGVLRLAVIAAVAIVALPGTALAQNLQLAGTVTRSVAAHPTPNVNVISKEDCEEAKDAFVFGYSIGDVGGRQLEVWVTDSSSLDCTLADDRSASAPTHCNLVFTEPNPKTTGGSLTIPSADIAHAISTVTSGTCEDTNSDTLPRALQIAFLLKSGANDDVDGSNAAIFTEAKIDMLGPPAPTDLASAPGEGAISLNFTPATTTDIEGYYVYCDPPADKDSGAGGAGGAGGASDASCPSGTSSVTSSASTSTSASSSAVSTTAASSSSASSSSTASSSTGSTTSVGSGEGGATASSSTASTAASGAAECPETALVQGQVPNCAYICGEGTGSTATARNLANGTNYSVAVAAFDSVGNVGKLSNVVCDSPIPVDDFFDLYRDAGGKGGNCACSTSARGDVLGAGLFAFAGLAALRRRKRGQR
jgi:MYXO-CTERM domain-containing protein